MDRWDRLDERALPRRERIRAERERMGLATAAQSRMGLRTRAGRPYEEHRCAEMPARWRVRRYGLACNPFDRDQLPTFTWAVVSVEVPDGWIEGDECQGVALGHGTDEPQFCPWCGETFPRLPDGLRGWEGPEVIPDD